MVGIPPIKMVMNGDGANDIAIPTLQPIIAAYNYPTSTWSSSWPGHIPLGGPQGMVAQTSPWWGDGRSWWNFHFSLEYVGIFLEYVGICFEYFEWTFVTLKVQRPRGPEKVLRRESRGTSSRVNLSNAEKPQQQVYVVIKSSKNHTIGWDIKMHCSRLLTLCWSFRGSFWGLRGSFWGPRGSFWGLRGSFWGLRVFFWGPT